MYSDTPLAKRAVEALVRNVWLMVICLGGVTGVAAVLIQSHGRGFTAVASTRVISDDTAAVVGLNLGPSSSSYTSKAEQNVARMKELLNDDRPSGFLNRVMDGARLDEPINVAPGAHDPRFIRFQKQLKLSSSGNLFDVGLTWENAGECERLVNSLRDEYIEEVASSKQASSLATERFLNTQIASYERRLRVAEMALIDYRQHNFGQLPEAGAADLRQLSSLRGQLADLQIQSRDNILKHEALKQRLAQVNPTSIREQTLGSDPFVGQLKQLEEERELLLVDYRPNSDEVRALDARIEAVRKLIAKRSESDRGAQRKILETKIQDNPVYQDVLQKLTDARIAQESNTAQSALIRQQIEQVEARIRKSPGAQRLLNERTRDYTILKAQYEALLSKREQAQIKGNLDRVSARSEFRPIGVVHAEPTMTRTKQALMIGGSTLAALLLGAVLIILREWTDRSARYLEDLERELGVPALASISEREPAAREIPRSLGHGTAGLPADA